MVDFSAPYNALIANNMQPGQNPLAVAGQVAQTQSALAQADDAQLQNAQNHLAFITNAMTPLLAKGSNITPADVAAAGADAVATSKGRISPQEISQFVSTLPQDGPGIQQALQQHQLRLLDAQRQIAAVRGEPVTTQTGGSTQFGTRDTFNGAYRPQQGPNGAIANQPSVGLTEGPSVMTPTGPQATRITNQQAYDIAQGRAHVIGGRIVYDRPSQGGAPQGGAPQTAATQPASTSGSPIPSPSQPPGGAEAMKPPPGALLPVGAPAGAAGAADVTSQGSASQGLALQKAADQAPTARATIDNMRAELQKFTSGPNAAKLNKLKAGANEIADVVAPGVGPRFDQQAIASQEQFHKNAEMLAQQAFAALGGTGTDHQLASAQGSNPNDALSGLGNKQILPMLEGLQDAVEAKNAAWQRYRQANGDGSYGQFSTDFNQNFSPRAFQFVRMDAGQRQELIQSMTPAEQRQLGAALQNAEQRGWIKPGG